MKRILSFALAAAVLMTATFAKEKAKVNADGSRTITVIGTTDLHGNIWGYSYEDNKETKNNGIARVYSYVKQVREENPDSVVLIDNGDLIQGTILTDDIYNKSEGNHPVITAMNMMKYDAGVLGNHEFNWGPNLILRIKKLAKYPILGANVKYKNGKKFVDGYTIVKRNGLKIGIIGITNPNCPRWDGEKLDSLEFTSVAEGFKSVYDTVAKKCDFVIVSAHVGFNAEYDEDHGTDAARNILTVCPDLPLLMVGHDHVKFSEKEGGTTVLSCRNLGRDVARFDITVDANKKVVDVKGEIIDMEKYEPSEELRSVPEIKAAHEKTIAYVSGGVQNNDGTVSGGIFGKASATFQPENEIKDIPEGKLRPTAVMTLINKIQIENSGADVSAAALFKDTSNIREGDVNYGTVFDIYKFDNTLYRVEVTGAELKKYMEWSAACYNQWVPGDVSISFNPDKPGYLYDMFYGVDYEINLSKPAGQRIENVMFKGAPLKDDQVLKLAVNNYRYSSALKTQKLVAGKKDWESPCSIRDMIVAYVQEHGTINPEVVNNWKITGVKLDSPYRAQLIEMVNSGKLEVPYAKSLNVNELKAAGVIK